MKECVFHIGMPKTGSSSLQESLFHGLEDTKFRYIDIVRGQINSCRALATIFKDQPADYHYHWHLGMTPGEVEDYRERLTATLDKQMAEAVSMKQTLIFSAENGWSMNRDEMMRFRSFMEEKSFRVRVIAYLRPLKSWLESNFQQEVRTGLKSDFELGPLPSMDYKGKIMALEDVYGPENVEVFKYDIPAFPDGCVVKHFCQRTGITFDPGKIRRSNESLSLPAVKLMYTYRRMGPGFGAGRMALFTDWLLQQRIAGLPGTAFRFHSSLVLKLLEQHNAQLKWLEERTGSSMYEDPCRHDSSECVRSENDLFDYDGETMVWLSKLSHTPKSTDPHKVAEMIHSIRNRPDLKSISAILKEILIRRLDWGWG